MVTTTLLEVTYATGPVQVDRQAGVIRSAKLLGTVSRNRRRYTRPALESAAKEYDGKPCYVNHPINPATGRIDVKRLRMSEERFGTIRNCQVKDDGVYGDIHYLKTHRMTEPILEAAERQPEVFGLSQNAEGDGHFAPDGWQVIESVHTVRSVDVVPDPGTTQGIFEQFDMTQPAAKVTVRSVLEKHLARRKAIVGPLLEMDDVASMSVDAPAATPDSPTDSDHDKALGAGVNAAAIAVINDKTMSVPDKISKIKKLLNAHAKLTGEKEDDSDPKDGKEDKDMTPAKTEQAELLSELKKLRKEKDARTLCESAGVTPDSTLLEALAELPTPELMKRLIDREKAKPASTVPTPTPTPTPGNKPKSQGPIAEQAAGSYTPPKDSKEFAARLKARR